MLLGNPGPPGPRKLPGGKPQVSQQQRPGPRLGLRKATAAFGLALFAAVGLAAFGEPASAQVGTEGIDAIVRQEVKNGDDVTQVPIAGAKISVTEVDGAEVANGVTDADGKVALSVPKGGDYIIKLDPASLPKDVFIPKDVLTTRPISVLPEGRQRTFFNLGKDTRAVKSKWARLPQTIFDGLYFGIILATAAVGLSLIYGATGLSNFAHGEMVTAGAVIAYTANKYMNLLPAAAIGIAAGFAIGFLFDRGVWRPLRARKTGLTSQMIASIGLSIFFQFFIQFVFGNRTVAYKQFQNQLNSYKIGPIEFVPRILYSIIICLVVLVALAFFLLKTRFGKAVRAVSDNPDLASATGINTQRVISIVWTIGGALAALGGVLVGLDQKVSWDRGTGLLLLMFAGVTLGGLGSSFAALAGSLVIGLAIEMTAWLFPDYIDLKRTGALVLLILVLLVRPQGLLGRKERVG
jgi:neutral amino acid transport system permease protein